MITPRMAVPALLLLLAAAPAAQDLASVTDWWYQLQGIGGNPLDIDALAAADHELLIIDYAADGTVDTEFTPADLATIHAAGGNNTLVVAYISIGEASDFRWYYEELTTNFPDVLAATNPQFKESRKVRYWEDDWKQFIIGDAVPGGLGDSYIKRIVDAGFDGVYLDIIDAYEFFGPKVAGGLGESSTAAEDMIQFVTEIAEYARVTLGATDFLVIPQNGVGIINPEQFPAHPDPEAAAADALDDYIAVIDAIGLEDVFHLGNRDENNKPRQESFRNGFIAEFLAADVPLFATEYLSAFRSNPKKLKFPKVAEKLQEMADSFGDDNGVPGAGIEIITAVRQLNTAYRNPLAVPGEAFAATLVVGQESLTATKPGLSSGRLRKPESIASDGVRLAIADTGNHRVLLYDELPRATGGLSSAVLGQPDFLSNKKGNSAASLDSPGGVCFNAAQVFVADSKNNRVLVWNGFPGGAGAPADFVLGQEDFSAKKSGTSDRQLRRPRGMACNDTQLFVCDSKNHRVLVWDLPIDATNAAATLVIGQADFGGRKKGKSASRMKKPLGVALGPAGQLLVADTSNNRVLLFDTVPVANGAEADLVLGQEDFGDGKGGTSHLKLRKPAGVAFDCSGRVLVADTRNQRVAIFDELLPNAPIRDVLGQGSMFRKKKGKGADGFAGPSDVTSLRGGAMFVVDRAHHRVVRQEPVE